MGLFDRLVGPSQKDIEAKGLNMRETDYRALLHNQKLLANNQTPEGDETLQAFKNEAAAAYEKKAARFQ